MRCSRKQSERKQRDQNKEQSSNQQIIICYSSNTFVFTYIIMLYDVFVQVRGKVSLFVIAEPTHPLTFRSNSIQTTIICNATASDVVIIIIVCDLMIVIYPMIPAFIAL